MRLPALTGSLLTGPRRMSGRFDRRFLLAFDRVGDHEKGAAMGVLTAVSDAAMFSGAILAGVVASTLGYPAVFWTGAVSVLAAGATVIPAMRSRQRRTVTGVPEDEGEPVAATEIATVARP